LIAIATSAAVPSWKRPTTSRVSAGLWLSNVWPPIDGHHSPAMKLWKVGVSVVVVPALGAAVSVMAGSVVPGGFGPT
jgi:hypothetical protein